MQKRLVVCLLLLFISLSVISPGKALAANNETTLNVLDAQNMEVGDYINFGSLLGKDIIWQVIGKEDGKFLLFSANELFEGQYDASLSKVVTNNLTSSRRYGSNSWRYSDIRTFLNSTATNVEYPDEVFDYSSLWQGLVSLSDGENTEPDYANIPGFLNTQNFSPEEMAIICDTKHKSLIDLTDPLADTSQLFPTIDSDFYTWDSVAQNYSSNQSAESVDRIFLLSADEVQKYLVSQDLDTVYGYYWLRDCIAESSRIESLGVNSMLVNGNELSCEDADSLAGVRPACWIAPVEDQTISGEGTLESPYVISNLPISDLEGMSDYCKKAAR